MQENYLAKWLNGELTAAELTEFKKSDEYATYKKIVDSSENIEAPDFNMQEAWDKLAAGRSKQQPKVISLSPFKSFLRIAAVVALLLAGSYFYVNTLDKSISLVSVTYNGKEVKLPFQRQHNTTIELKNIDTEQLFTGTFSNTDKELALRSISVPLQIKFKLEDNKVLFYGENAP